MLYYKDTKPREGKGVFRAFAELLQSFDRALYRAPYRPPPKLCFIELSQSSTALHRGLAVWA